MAIGALALFQSIVHLEAEAMYNGPVTVVVQLTQGQHTIIDDEDQDAICGHLWRALKVTHGFYAGRTIGGRSNKTTVYMHRVITGAQPGTEVDHIDGNKLNNVRKNLRVVSRSVNANNPNGLNLGPKNRRTGLRGVQPHGSGWTALITHEGRRIYVGQFDSPEKAGAAFDHAAVTLRGPNTRLNGPIAMVPTTPFEFPPRGYRYGEAHPRAKLTDDDVRDIRMRCERGESLRNIANIYGVAKNAIWQIKQAKTWR